MSIQLLSPSLASQIAAGEVIERPASVVKELLENALDAGATQITITTIDGGRTRIEVADNGSGIPQDELALAVERHATSKIQTAEDLFAIRTLGFRGEALASIGSVSRFKLVSSLPHAKIGAEIHVDGGAVASIQPIGAPQGTVVTVADLFYNVPARLNFLKKDVTERRQIDQLVTRYALAYPEVRIHLEQDGKTALRSSGNGDRREILAQMYGSATARQLLAVEAQYEDLTMSGFISPIAVTRASRREISLFVNGRWVQDSTLSTAVVRAYHTLLMVGRFPLATLFLSIPPEQVDVNVHPTKAEVRFRNRDRVFSDVQRAVKRGLLAHTPVPEVHSQNTWSQPVWQPPEQAGPSWGGSIPSHAAQTRGPLPFTTPGASDVPDQPELPVHRLPLLRLIGQVANTYLIAEGPDGLYLVDQHAAHERVLFEQFMAQRGDQIPAQTLLEPQAVQLPIGQASLLEDQLSVLGNLGFEVEPFGKDTFLVRATPVLLGGMNPAAALSVLVEDFEEDETPLQQQVEAKIIARVCKRAAVKAGQTLSMEEQRVLLRDLEACDAPRTCPHGRPTMIHLSVDLLERQFGRRGAR
jgi:DNA mismatch repair protein MutL